MIRAFPEQLAQQLSKQLAPIYLLSGTDPLLLSESENQITQAANAQGFDEKNRLAIDNQTDWQAIQESIQEQGLFFNRQILVLECPESLNASQQKQLTALLEMLHEDVLLILSLPKFTKAAEKQPWFVLINERFANTLLINCQTPTAENLPQWLNQRLKSMKLQADSEAQQLLCYSYENNLLGLKQALDILALLHSDKKLSYERVRAVVEQSSMFTPFQWIDTLLAGKSGRAKRILQGLQAEDVQGVILLRTLQRELLLLLELSRPMQPYQLKDKLPSQQLRGAFDRLKIWQNRRALYTQALQRMSYQQLYKLIQELAQLERLAKRDFSADIWQGLADLSSHFSL